MIAADPRPLVIYDGQCRFCRAQIAWLTALDITGRLRFVSLHDPAIARDYPDLAHADLMSQMYVVDSRGRRMRGADAVRYLTRHLPCLWWAAPLLHVPGSRAFWRWAYQHVARRRYVFGRACDDGTCRL